MAGKLSSVAKSPWTGAMGAVAGAVTAAVGFIGPPPTALATNVTVTSDQWHWLGIGLVVAFASAIQAFWALYSRNQKVQADLDNAQNALTKRQTDQQYADLLTEKYREGLHRVLHAPIDSDAEFQHWQIGEKQWTAEVIAMLKTHGCSKQEISCVEELHEVPQDVFHHPEHMRQHQKSMLSLRLNRLKRVIDRYSENPILTP